MKDYSPKTRTGKVLVALQNGEVLTQAAANKRFNVGNLSAEATRLRQAGYPVVSQRRKAGNGQVVLEYKMGQPDREVIALGYRAKSLGISIT